jgi:predicted polyphosphate/ATP-dependent NAD kinase
MKMSTPSPTPDYDNPPIVGLIANPVASKDIRRLVGLARVVDVEEKANLIARLLVGMSAGPPVAVLALDDSGSMVRRALRLTRGTTPLVEFLPIQAEGSERDTHDAAAMLRARGARVLVTVGGDGTIRSAVEGWPDARLVPLAAGTNNAMAIVHEPTMVGYATSLAAAEHVHEEAYDQLTTMVVHSDQSEPSTAVVDVAGVRTRWTGARALWEPDDLVEAIVANARPEAVGIASVAAAFGPIPPRHARYIRFGPGRTVRAIFGPGLIADVSVAEYRTVAEGARIHLASATRVVALDGERRLIRGDVAYVDVVPGAFLHSVSKTLTANSRTGGRNVSISTPVGDVKQ